MCSGPDPLDGYGRDARNALRDLLVHAVRAADNPGQARAVMRAAEIAPLAELPRVASLHRLSGAVLRGLDRSAPVPETVRRALDEDRGHSGLQHLLMIGALSDVARAFDDRGIRWVTMKGPVVTELWYSDVGDRRYADLDVLVIPRDFPRAMATLEELGYVTAIRNWALATSMMAGQVNMTGPTIQIDLHWALHYSDTDRRSFELVPQAMIERSRLVDIAGLRVPTFDTVDTIISLAFHAARSGGHRLVWLKDLERAISVDEPDFDEIVRRAIAGRCGPSIGVMLGRARTVLAADVPDDVVRALTPMAIRTAQRVVASTSPLVPLHDRDSAARWFTRSLRSTTARTGAEIPRRTVRYLNHALRTPRPNETDDPAEKARFLDEVAVSDTRGRP